MPLTTPPPSPTATTRHIHHRHRLKDLEWDELPKSGIQAAKCLGYTEDRWTNGEYWKTEYWQLLPFEKLSNDQRRAATYLGWNLLDYKLNGIKWNAISKETQKHAIVLGWDSIRWDNNWPTRDVASQTYAWKDWKELTHNQQVALMYFGYNQNLWDRVGKEEVFVIAGGKKKKAASSLSPPKQRPTTSSGSSSSSSPKKNATTQKQQKQFTQTQLYGTGSGINLNFLEGETKFDHGNHRHIDEIWIYGDKDRIYGIMMIYDKILKEIVCNIPTSNKNNNIQKMKLRQGEYITTIKIYNNKNRHYIKGLTFISNRGTQIDSSNEGGNKHGNGQQEIIVNSPSSDDIVLCGIFGTATKQHINSIGFRWGPKNIS